MSACIINTVNDDEWRRALARRAVEGVGARAGELVLVRDGAGDRATFEEMLLAVEEAGATPLPEIAHREYIRRLLERVPLDYLTHWDRHRTEWMRRIDRLIVLARAPSLGAGLPAEALAAWEQATARINAVEERKNVPFLLCAVPTEEQETLLQVARDHLYEMLVPALLVPATDLNQEIDAALAAAQGARTLTIRSGDGEELRLSLHRRHWLADDGVVDGDDLTRGAGVSNLPAGSIYIPPLERSAEGNLWLPEAGPARDVRLTFAGGRVVAIEAATGGEELQAMFDRHTGEPRRISHVGIGLNPHLRQPVGWLLVDEHVHGTLFIAFGENRYMGGENESSLNVDFCSPAATILADERVIVQGGRTMFG